MTFHKTLEINTMQMLDEEENNAHSIIQKLPYEC